MADAILVNASKLEDSYKNRVENLCRLCLLQTRELDLNSDSYLPYKRWIDILFCVTNIDYEKTNKSEYPQGICKECSSKLVLFYKFKQKVASSHNTLEIIFTNNDRKDTGKSLKGAVEYLEETYNDNSTDDFMNVIVDFTEEKAHSDDELCDMYSVGTEICNQNEEECSSLYNLMKIDDPSDNKKFICYFEINEQADKLVKDEEEQPLFDSNLGQNSLSSYGNLGKGDIEKNKKKAKNIQCNKCGAKFTRNSSLRQHDTVHSTEKKFECSLCNKKFTRRAHVDIHMLIHSNIRPHSCQTCGRAFTKSGDLKRHQKIHSDVYEFVCLICNKEFKRKEYLATHVNTHYGVKPYKCKYCGKCYQSLSGLLKHTKNVHSHKIDF